MSENSSDHGFDWMRAYLACSIAYEFALLKGDAEKATGRYVEALKKKGPQSTFQFQCEACKEEYDYFVVSRTSRQFQRSGSTVTFTRQDDHIEVAVHEAKNDEATKHKITLTLNNEGQCRYQIDGDGEYLRWQVLKSMLLGVMFPAPV